MIPPSLARLIELADKIVILDPRGEKYDAEGQSRHLISDSEMRFYLEARRALPALQSMTAEEPVAWMHVAHGAVITDRNRADMNEQGKRQYSIPLFSHPPLVAAKEIEGRNPVMQSNLACYICGAPAFCSVDINIGACAAGAGNMKPVCDKHNPYSAHPQTLVDAEAAEDWCKEAAREIYWGSDWMHVTGNGYPPDDSGPGLNEMAVVIRKHSQERAGWVLVPKIPTDDMIVAAVGAWVSTDASKQGTTRAIWEAMLKAAAQLAGSGEKS